MVIMMGKKAKTIAKLAIARRAVKQVPIVIGAAALAGKSLAGNIRRTSQKKKGEITMKKSTFVSLIVFLSAVAGALGAAYLYLMKREKELDEYEQMLFSEDYEDDTCEAEDADTTEQAPAAAPSEEPAE